MAHGTTSKGGNYTALLTLGALGVVYGDIGTSPLYAFREAFHVGGLPVTEAAVLGVLSLIFWGLALVVTIKYLIFVMRADNDGEGGILALTSLIMSGSKGTRSRVLLIGVGLFGTALLYGDGMITPAISVLSAVEGLEVAVSGLGPWVIPVACFILIVLFMNQHRGTSTLGTLFGPIMVLWFSVLALLGIIQIIGEPGVLAAVNPMKAVAFVADSPRFAFLALGGVFLVVTGSEALYADMGHFGIKPIRLGWFGLVFPALVINYFGQGALLLQEPEAIENPFYLMAPDWAVLPMVVLATLATVIASQALISGAYSLTAQAIKLGYLPRQHVDHTSPRQFGQIYVPTINWILMIAAVGLVIGFGSSSNLAAAYGVGVATDMVITTLLLFVVMRDLWKWKLPVVFGLTLLFLAVDLTFFGANITKVPAGGWFPLVIGVIGFVLMTTWKKGQELMVARARRNEFLVERFIASIVEHPQMRVPGIGVYLFPQVGATPPSLLTNLKHHEVLHETIILLAVDVEPVPRVPRAQRATVHDLGEGFSQVVLKYGFFEAPNIPLALGNIVVKGFGFKPTIATYFLGNETIVATEVPGMALWREHLYAFMHRNSASAARYFGLPQDRIVEVGVQVEI
jgi:KUP system potassium uptake protein